MLRAANEVSAGIGGARIVGFAQGGRVSQPILPIILLPIIQIIRHPGHSTHEGRSAALAALASGHDGASFAEADGAAAPQLAGGGELGPKGWGF